MQKEGDIIILFSGMIQVYTRADLVMRVTLQCHIFTEQHDQGQISGQLLVPSSVSKMMKKISVNGSLEISLSNNQIVCACNSLFLPDEANVSSKAKTGFSL